MDFSDFICIFALFVVKFTCLFCDTKTRDFSALKSPEQLIVSQSLKNTAIYSVARLKVKI